MSTKDEVLAILEQRRVDKISGQKIADELGVSRTAVWKAINTLKADGYLISSTTNAGYKLINPSDSLNTAAIKPLLDRKLIVETYQTIDSTNAEAKRRLNDNPHEDILILAESQEKGRGRLGRTFYSPSRNGIYMSLTLHDLNPQNDATLVTTAAAVAVCQAIEELTDLKPQIKWVNDIFIDGKKICGILTEGILSLETQTIQSIILGIGLNVLEDENLPAELQQIVGSLFKKESPVSRNHLAASIINQFFRIYETMGTREYLDEYRERCFVLGRNVSFVKNNETYSGLATGIDDTGALEIQLTDNTTTKISYGEISINWRNES
ncbi:biotin--[acetyl-CoA-carboxylase] ligase [Jeotgalibaca sp. A127]|uniref:biotin--[acetyl-CoA-carboxylase] ligase n=1 Tax=Jeotgalibaca sp. A127 TaxID=3457324 RepID=UPI003FD602B5